MHIQYFSNLIARHESMHEISDEGTIKTKLEMLDSLIDYEAASKIILGSIKVR